MGTRGLVVVQLNNEYKVCQYGQWDFYPTGQGDDITKFLIKIRDANKMEAFKEAVSNCSFVDASYHEEVAKELNLNGSGWLNMEQAERYKAKYPELSRDTGGKILDLIYENGGAKLESDLAFAGESLFCEWAYVVDLDNQVLEVYKGFNKTRLSEEDRFYNFKVEGNGYQPVRMVAWYKFEELNSDVMTELAEALNKED